MKLLKKMCAIHAPSGEELELTKFILLHIKKNQIDWKVKPILHYGDGFQDNIIMVFGRNPKTAIFAHLDSIGFTVKYNNEIVKIGGPVTNEEIMLVGEDSKGKIEGKIIIKEEEKTKKYLLIFIEQLRGELHLPLRLTLEKIKVLCNLAIWITD